MVLSPPVRAYLLCFVAVLSFAQAARAQATPVAKPTITVGDFELSPELEVRIRGEYRRNPVDMGGGGGPANAYTEDPWAVMERTRVGLGADRGPLRAKVTLQDARVWGTTPPTAAFTPLTFGSPQGNQAFASTGLYEGFIEVHTTEPGRSTTDGGRAIPNPQYIRVGRQAIVWDGGRLLGNADFSPVARTLDAVRGHVGWRSLDFEAFGAILDEARPVGIGFGDPPLNTADPYSGGTQLYGGLVSLTLDPLFKAQLYGLFRPATGQSGSQFITSDFVNSRVYGDNWTVALGVSGDSKGWRYGVTGALQLGRVQSVDGPLDRLAYAVVGDASRTFDGILLTPTVKIGAGFASGGKSATQYNQFDPLYPDVQVNHGLLGAFAWSNLIDIHGGVSIVPVTDLHVTAEYRYARMVDTSGEWLDTYLVVTGPAATATSQELGHEVDVMVSYRPWPAFNVSAGYALLILGDGAKQLMAAEGRGNNVGGVIVPPDLSHYAFVQLTLNVPARP